jgi:hypothetical protein
MAHSKFVSLFLLGLISISARAQDVQQIAKQALTSTVSLTFFNYAYSDKITGSGFVVKDNIIATNYHVVCLGNEGYIQKSQTDTLRHVIKRLIAIDPENDLALIEVENLGLPSLSISTEELNIGEKIYAAGNPLGLTGTFSDGIVSANRKIDDKQVIQITAPISSGSSGGPVLNSNGKVVGVVFSSYKSGQNLNFVVPSNKLVALMSQKQIPILLQQTASETMPEEEMSSLLYERFNDEFSSHIKGLKIKQGAYSVLETNNKTNYVFVSANSLRYKPDFVIEARLKTQAGKNTCLYWGALSNGPVNFTNRSKSNRSFNFVLCQKDGHANLARYFNDEYKELKEPQAVPSLQKGEFNVLKIRKKGDSLYFYANEVILYTQAYRTFLGSEVGVGSEDAEAKVSIDYVSVKQAGKKLFSPNILDTTRKAIKLPEEINSKYNDYYPVISPDGETLFFTRYDSPQNMGKSRASDIYQGPVSGGKATFSNAQKFNTESDNYCFGTSNDGGTLYIENIEDPSYGLRTKPYLNLFSLDKKEAKDWPSLKSFYCYDNYSVYTVNKEENYLIASLKRADTFGSSDLFVSHKNKDGNWSEFLNMGQVLNTEYNEGSSFITADNKYLIFNSEGHLGYGQGDLFISERLDSTWLNWSTPKNLGPGINTKGDENYPYINLKTNELYFNYTEENKNNADIYKIALQPGAQSNVTLGILQFEKPNLEVEVISLPENTSQKFSVGNRKNVHFVFQNNKKYTVKTYQDKVMVTEKTLDFTKRNEFKEETIQF